MCNMIKEHWSINRYNQFRVDLRIPRFSVGQLSHRYFGNAIQAVSENVRRPKKKVVLGGRGCWDGGGWLFGDRPQLSVKKPPLFGFCFHSMQKCALPCLGLLNT